MIASRNSQNSIAKIDETMNWKYGILIAVISMIVSILLIGFTYIPGGSIDAPLSLITPVFIGILSIIIFLLLYKISKGLSLALLILLALMNVYYGLFIFFVNQ